MRTSRRGLLKAAGAGALCAILPSGARAAQFTYKVGTGYPAGHPLSNELAAAAKDIAEKSGGRMEVLVFASSQLGGDSDMLSQVRSGALEIYASTNNFIGTFVPVASIGSMPFAFADYSKVWQAMDGGLGELVRRELGKTGVHVMPTFWDNGFRHLTNSKRPVRTVADLAGLKIRVPVSPLNTSLFRALGAAPVAMNFPELYPALQTGVVDGQENPLAIVETGKLFEVQKYCSLSSHIWDGSPVLVNPRAWAALPDDLKGIVETAFNEAGLRERTQVRELNDSLRAKLEGAGMAFNDVDTASFRAALSKAGFYGEWKAKYGAEAWKVLEDSVGALA